METKEVKLVLTIVKKDIYYGSCEVFDSIYDLKTAKNVTIAIPKYLFAASKEKKTIKFKLIRAADSSKFRVFKFNIYYGINKAYCFLDSEDLTLKLFEICFYKPAKIKYNEDLLTETDSFENDSRTRIILINSPQYLSFDDIEYDLEKIKTKRYNASDNSFEVAFFDVSRNYFASKLIKERENFSIIKTIEIYKKDLKESYGKINDLFSQKEQDKDKYLEIIKKYNVPEVEINFSQRKSFLENEFKNQQDYELMYWYILRYAIGSYYGENKEENIPIIDLFDCCEKSYNEFLNDGDLLIYEKVMLIFSKILYLMSFTSMNKYENSKLKYFKNKENKILPKSVFGICFNFIKEFIKNLTPQSYLFYPLLLLDSGVYVDSEQNPIYGFNMETCEVIKSHLNELVPSVFFLYEEEVTLVKKEGGFNYKGYGIVFINKLLALNEFEKDPALFEYEDEKTEDEKTKDEKTKEEKTEDEKTKDEITKDEKTKDEKNKDERINKHYGMRVGKTMIHESFCHNKYIFQYKAGYESPTNFYNAEMNLIKIVPVGTPIYTNNYLPVAKEKNKGESGKFFEYFFGLYYGELVIDLIYKVNYIGKLIDNVKYFAEKDLNIITQYITYKHLIYEKKIKYNEWNNNESLENEITTMKKLINEHQSKILKIIQPKVKEEDIKQNAIKKPDILSGYKFIEEKNEPEEYKGYNYYKKKVREAKNADEYFKYSAELYKHLKVA